MKDGREKWEKNFGVLQATTPFAVTRLHIRFCSTRHAPRIFVVLFTNSGSGVLCGISDFTFGFPFARCKSPMK